MSNETTTSTEVEATIETAIKDVITQKLAEGIIERLVAENLEKGINKSLENLLGNYGDVTKIIEKKIKSVMISQLSSYDYSKYIVKLDCVLTEILKKTSLDNKNILTNFKELMIDSEFPKVVKLSDIFEVFKKFVAKNVDTGKLEVEYDDGVSYEHVSVTMEVVREKKIIGLLRVSNMPKLFSSVRRTKTSASRFVFRSSWITDGNYLRKSTPQLSHCGTWMI